MVDSYVSCRKVIEIFHASRDIVKCKLKQGSKGISLRWEDFAVFLDAPAAQIETTTFLYIKFLL